MKALLLVPFLLAVSVLGGSTAAATATPAADGRLVFASDRGGAGTNVYSVRPDGTGLVQLTDTGLDRDPAVSPDGRTIAVSSSRDGADAVFVMRSNGSDFSRVTPTGLPATQPAWSPDGTHIAFLGGESACCNRGIYTVDVDGGGLKTVWAPAFGDPVPVIGSPDWSPDGQRIAFTSLSPDDGSFVVYAIDADGRGLTRLGAGQAPSWSPDGGRIAFASPTGDAIGVMNADGSGPHAIATGLAGNGDYGEALAPAWSPDGGSIAFGSGLETGSDGQTELFVVPTDGGSPQRLTTTAASEFSPSWQPLRGGFTLGDGRVSITSAAVIAPARFVLGPVTVSPARACGARLVHVRTQVSDSDGHVVRGVRVTVRSVPAGRVRAVSAATGTAGGATLAVRPAKTLRHGRLTLSLTAAGLAKRVSVPVRC